ncbi:MAG: hypothetical protein ACKO68_07225, partial [Bacteroidota bacterium]
MNRKHFLVVIAVAIVSGTLPFAAYLLVNRTNRPSSDEVLDGSRYYAKTVSLNGDLLPDLSQASQMSINSVVHVTTKVVSTTFQRDMFQ